MTRSGGDFDEPELGFVAAFDAFDDEAFRFEIIGEKQAQGGFVFDDEDARRRRSRAGASARPGVGLRWTLMSFTVSSLMRLAVNSESGRRTLRPIHRQGFAGHEIDDGLGNIGRVVADALDVLRAEQQMRAKGDIARILHHEGQKIAEHRILERVELGVVGPHLRARARRRACA